MKARNVVYICAPSDSVHDAQWSAAIDYVSAEEQRRDKWIAFSGFATRPTLRSALRFARRVFRLTGCAMVVQRRARREGRRTKEWLVKEEN